MATFAYRATARDGRSRKGVINASTARAARNQLRQQGLRIESIRTSSQATRGTSLSKIFDRRHRGRATTMFREMATLLQVGVPLLESLETVTSQARGSFRSALASVQDSVASGTPLADALANHPAIFDEMAVGMVRVGEHAGNLDAVLHQLSDYRERASRLRGKVQSALLYPAIVLAISVAVALFLMTAVVPMLLNNLAELGRTLPWPTRVLKFISDNLLAHGWWVAILLFGLTAAACLYFSTARGQRILMRTLVRAPVLGMLIRRQAISQMAIVVASLLKSGVELVEALRIAENTSGNVLIKDALGMVRADLATGRDLSDTLATHPIFPLTVVHVFSLGQRSGELDSMLQRLGEDYDRQAESLSSRLATVLEPVLILFLAVVVGFILFATMLPILEAGNILEQ